MGDCQEERESGRSSQVLGPTQTAFHRVWGTTGEYHGSSREVSPSPSKFHVRLWVVGCALQDNQGCLLTRFINWVSGSPWNCVGGVTCPTINSVPIFPPPLHALVLPVSSSPTNLCSHSSMAQRADLLEFDCQLTRDGVVVVSHDKNLSRQSGLNKDVNTLDFEVSFAAPHTESCVTFTRAP